ncbi:MAG TPA: alanine--tRNA ligase [Acidobacteriaceae bacterium]|nr:alanine--tRNA ligase [Acidobacteriaceae bacterium]
MLHRSGSDIRETFLRFFESKGHRRVHSASLVPANDPTLLFTNAGMNEFKDVFLGTERRDYSRATSSQKCVRAGGKHNDLENVGFTRRHHTFFEMLGNFSFGDYFKREAIAYAWELVTSPDWLALPKDKLYITIFKGEQGIPRDQEAYDLWRAQGVPAERIHALGMKDNFWAMGDTGPCGPCSEIFYDMGLAASETGADKPFGEDDSRYVEIWNLVFMQFDRNLQGELNLLPSPSIDTGAGLERMAAVLQGKISNFETDLFTPLIARAAELTGTSYQDGGARSDASLRIIADHARAATFLISDGVLPANEGRGYVLRKILRRGIRHGRLLGTEQPFMFEMVFAVRDQMQAAYPELNETAGRVAKVVQAEEERFGRTLAIGSKQLDAAIVSARAAGDPPKLDGSTAFHLYETFGLPLDFMMDAARDQGLEFDLTGFERARAEEQTRARASWKGGAKSSASPVFRELPRTVFEGYRQLSSHGCEILAIVRDGLGVSAAKAGESVEVVLDHTAFYADSGGQVGDVGRFYAQDHGTVVADVLGCVQPVQGVRAHKVYLRQPIQLGDRIDTVVDEEYRNATRRNHTGTHLLHAGLREVLGTHVKQAGSLVDPTRLRFDFSHFTGVADEELQDIEDLINKEVLANIRVETLEDVPIEVAINEYHAMALFGEKYGERVRVVKIGDFSTELCGGTHTGATGEIGVIKLLSEASVSSGVRRVEAVTGLGALQQFRSDQEVAQFAGQVSGAALPGLSPAEALRNRIAAQEDEIKKLRRELDQVRMKSAASSVSSATSQAVDVEGVKVIAQRVDALERGQLRTLVDNLRNKLGSGIVILGSSQPDGKVALIVGVTQDLTARFPAGKIIAPIAGRVGGKGGGRPDIAEAGGKDASALNAALAEAPEVVRALLAGSRA